MKRFALALTLCSSATPILPCSLKAKLHLKFLLTLFPIF